MIDPRIRLRHLQCFLDTARLGSLSAAAQAMNVSQPAASKTIRELEDILGCALFDRSGRRLVLTPAGRVFQQHVGSALIELSRAQALVRDVPRASTRLAVGVLPTAATELLPSAALTFREDYPDCLLRVTTGPNWLLMSQLRDSSLDLVVGRMSTAKVMEGLTFKQLYQERIVAAVRPGHPLLDMKNPIDDLADYPLVLPPPGAVIARVVRAFLARHGVVPETHAMETVSLAFGRKIVQSSDAIWFISEGVIANECTDGSLRTLNLHDEMFGSPVGVSLREDGRMTDERKALLAALEVAAKGRS